MSYTHTVRRDPVMVAQETRTELLARLDVVNRALAAEEAVRERRLARLRRVNKKQLPTYAPSASLVAAVAALGIPDDPDWQRHRTDLQAALS